LFFLNLSFCNKKWHEKLCYCFGIEIDQGGLLGNKKQEINKNKKYIKGDLKWEK